MKVYPIKRENIESDSFTCKSCGETYDHSLMKMNLNVCPKCQYHYPVTAYDRISMITDSNSFSEFNKCLTSVDPLYFPEYKDKLVSDKKKTSLYDGVITGEASIGGYPVVICVMDSRFRMGSMGSAVGEKITRSIEESLKTRKPLIIFSASGGARMQEGILSLMQMAKTSGALEKLNYEKILFVSVLTNPTTGGVSASFASLGDINIAEPQALIGFAGRRIIEQTIREELPENFQTSEFLLEHGQLDMVVNRCALRQSITTILKIHHLNFRECLER
ncbi:acetyl-CoA carboxylase, carboxyltransferase subunit beta [Peribacillus simplex]|uniref:acetyl-CoA carboxylase, carboxyltransferase subunit beta n=1 Tax=Peribacillus simplex TaxID=1478 RepID=UPI003B8E4D6A